MRIKSNRVTNKQWLRHLLAAALGLCLASCSSTGYFNPQPVINYCPSTGLSFSCKFGS